MIGSSDSDINKDREDDQPGVTAVMGSMYVLLLCFTVLYTGHVIQSRLKSSSSKTPLLGGSAEKIADHEDSSLSPLRVPTSQSRTDVALGLICGTLFGMSACVTRTGFLLAREFGSIFSFFGIIASIYVTGCGVAMRTEALKRGATVVICSSSAMATIVTVIFVGVVCLDEPLPQNGKDIVFIFFSWIGMLIAVAILASSDRSNKKPEE